MLKEECEAQTKKSADRCLKYTWSNKFTHCKLQVSNSAKATDMRMAAETVRPSNRWSLKNIANFSRNLSRGQIDRTRSLLHSERLSKFWLLEITRVYYDRHVKRHFASDKQTWCWYKLSKVTNQRVYQELVYRNEVFKTMFTGSPVAPSFSTRPLWSPARISIVNTDREPGKGYFIYSISIHLRILFMVWSWLLITLFYLHISYYVWRCVWVCVETLGWFFDSTSTAIRSPYFI